jgi:hypothetical protein
MEAQVKNAVEIALNPDAQYTLKQQVLYIHQSLPYSTLSDALSFAGSRIYCTS